MSVRAVLTDDDILSILGDITYPGFRFALVGVGAHPFYVAPASSPSELQVLPGAVALQIVCDGTDNISGEPLSWKSRKWLLSRHMTRGEIVQTAFKAVMTAIEHEAREQFTYRGQAVMDPHYDIDKLVALRAQPDALLERVLVVRAEDVPAMAAVEGGSAGPHDTEFPISDADLDPQP